MSTAIARLAQSSAVHVLFAFLTMGGWAIFANRGHAMPAPLLAGLVQGGLSASITLVLKRVIETLAARFGGLPALIAPPVIAGLISASLLTAVHMISGTPEIVETIALPLSVATFYAAIYNYTLWRSKRC
ncbi:hypothetical protein DUT91_22975 [Phyllobacterium salinisoli]|uniref:Transmembrane protein n=1 Tax=Phyllobacterium salinisoli TaxID=1899321 RepID=A0A368JXI3_9HYPH|nr:hypothetical protein [Phyllobacterium salinisoli]RCS21604.1 hypothetical protein DUT91_22975 [Phyllobacterium salinisoli]